MAAHGCDLDTAFKFLSDHTGWAGERDRAGSGSGDRTSHRAEAEAGGGATAEAGVEAAAEPATSATGTPVTDELEQYTRDVPGWSGTSSNGSWPAAASLTGCWRWQGRSR